MSSEHPFDDHLKQAFEGFEPDVQPQWAEFETSLEGQGAAPATTSGRGVNRWAVAAAVVAGGAFMWVTQPIVEDLFTEAASEKHQVEVISEFEDGQSFDEAWEEFTHVTQEFAEDMLDAEAEAALAEVQEASTSESRRYASEDNTGTGRANGIVDAGPRSSEVVPYTDHGDSEGSVADVERLLAELFSLLPRHLPMAQRVFLRLQLARTIHRRWWHQDCNSRLLDPCNLEFHGVEAPS